MSVATPTIEIDGSASSGGGSSPSNAIGTALGEDYASLIAMGSNAFSASGAKTFNIDAGALSIASTAQIGRVFDGVTITAAMVQQNQYFLNKIAIYCNTYHIGVVVGAQLDNAPSNDWTYQWLLPSVQAGLPIVAVENDDEVEPAVAGTAITYAQRAAYEVNIVAQIAKYYPNVKIGQWETDAPLSQTQAWWNAYDSAANAAGLPDISYVVADTPWNDPTLLSQASWQSWQLGLSQLVQANHMSLTVMVDGVQSDTSGQQWTAQSEQHAAMLAELPGMVVSTVLVRTWGVEFPEAVLPATSPTTIANDAAEVAATYPLYQTGSITEQDLATVTAAGQEHVVTGVQTAVTGASMTLIDTATAGGGAFAVVIMDDTGLLSATQEGAATVTGAGTTQLVLDGTLVDLKAELATLTVDETAQGPDTLDYEVFNINGRTADTQETLFALPAAPSAGAYTYSFTAPLASQGWTSATVTMNAASVVTSEVLTWNPTDYNTTTGQYVIDQTVSIHEPLDQLDVVMHGSGALDTDAQPSPGGSAALPFGDQMVIGSFDPSLDVFVVNVLSTTLTYNAFNGSLQTETDVLAPTDPVALIPGTSLSNYFATGGMQVTQFNTTSNPNWQSNWATSLASVTTVTDSSGQIVEQIFQGGVSDPYFTLDNVFDPYTGKLWEQIQSAPSSAADGTFVSGPKYVTQFNTGDNPNWDYADWGNAPQVTVVWQDWKVFDVTAAAPVPTGLVTTDAYTSGPTDAYGATGNVTLTGTVSGTTFIGGNGNTSVIGIGHDVIYTGGGTSTILTGNGHSQIYALSGQTSQVTIRSAGGDTIYAGTANLALTNSGQTADTVIAQGGTVTLGGLIGSVTTTPGLMSDVVASANGGSFDLTGTADIASIGNNATVTFDGSGAIVNAGSGAIVNAWGNGNTLIAGSGAHVWLTSGQNSVTTGAGSMLDEAGAANTGTIGNGSSGLEYGTGDSITAASTCTVNLYAVGGTVTAGAYASVLMQSSGDVATVGAHANVTVTGSSNTATVGNNSSVTMTGIHDILNLNGTNDVAQIGSGDTIDINGGGVMLGVGAGCVINGIGSTTSIDLQGSADIAHLGNTGTVTFDSTGGIVTAGDQTIANAWGASNTLTAGASSKVWLTSSGNDVSVGANSMLDEVGARNFGTIGAGSVGFEYGIGGTIYAQSNCTIDVCAANNTVIAGSHATIWMSSTGSGSRITTGTNSTVSLTGNNGTATVGSSSTVVATGTSDTVDLTGVGDVAQIANGGTIILDGTGAFATAGTNLNGNAWSNGNTIKAGAGSQVWLTSGQNTVSLGANSMLDEAGASNNGTIGAGSIGLEIGANNTITANGTLCIVNQYGADETVTGGDYMSVWMQGNNGVAAIGALGTVTAVGNNNTITTGTSATITLAGSHNSVLTYSQSMVFITGMQETVAVGAGGGTQTVQGFNAAKGDVLDLSRLLAGQNIKADMSNLGNFVTIMNTAAASVLAVMGNADTITFKGAGPLTLAGLESSHAVVVLPH